MYLTFEEENIEYHQQTSLFTVSNMLNSKITHLMLFLTELALGML